MSSDFWRQWQALFAQSPSPWNPGSPFATSGSNPGASSAGFAPFTESADRFAAAFREYAAAAQRGTPDAAAEAAKGFGNFLREQFAGSFRPAWQTAPGAAPPSGPGFAQAPPLGLGREQMLRAERAAEAWNRLTEAQSRLHRMWSDTLRDAAAAFTARLQTMAGEQPAAQTAERIYDEWIECAEEAYGRTAHSEAFCDALSASVNAAAQWRRESSAGMEELAKLWDLPTRSEVNALSLRLRDLEAQLAALTERPRTRPARARPARARPAQSSTKPRAPRRKPIS